MSKYQEALNRVNKSITMSLACLGIDLEKDEKTASALKTLQKLVDEHEKLKEEYQKLKDKETPKKPLVKKYENSEHYLCPSCKGRRFGILDYGEYKNEWRKGSELMSCCPNCGQKLDWSG